MGSDLSIPAAGPRFLGKRPVLSARERADLARELQEFQDANPTLGSAQEAPDSLMAWLAQFIMPKDSQQPVYKKEHAYRRHMDHRKDLERLFESLNLPLTSWRSHLVI
jgi:hypothetical protein